MEELIKKLQTIAKEECYSDCATEEETIDDYAGGNLDDAFSLGETEGRVLLAREILGELVKGLYFSLYFFELNNPKL